MKSDPIPAPFSLFDLTGRRALITDARRGIGRAIALSFGAQGAHVIVHHADAPGELADAEAVQQEIVSAGGTADRIESDFSSAGSAREFAQRVTDAFGPVDILVLNASIEILEDYDAISTENFDLQIAINLRAQMELLQALLPSMQQRG